MNLLNFELQSETSKNYIIMVQGSNSTTQPIDRASLIKRMLLGAGIALVVILLFVLPASMNPNPAWPKLWIIRPLIITPLAGAAGGAFYYFMEYLRSQRGWSKILTIVLSVIVYLIGLWMGTILGLDGTMWD